MFNTALKRQIMIQTGAYMTEKIFVQVKISEPGVDTNGIRALKSQLAKTVQESNPDVKIQNINSTSHSQDSKDGLGMAESILLSLAPALLPQVIQTVQSWLIGRRKVSIQMPNGMKVEFTASKNLTEDEIGELIKKISQP